MQDTVRNVLMDVIYYVSSCLRVFKEVVNTLLLLAVLFNRSESKNKNFFLDARVHLREITCIRSCPHYNFAYFLAS